MIVCKLGEERGTSSPSFLRCTITVFAAYCKPQEGTPKAISRGPLGSTFVPFIRMSPTERTQLYFVLLGSKPKPEIVTLVPPIANTDERDIVYQISVNANRYNPCGPLPTALADTIVSPRVREK